jgi:Family of unknown function (DUF5990)
MNDREVALRITLIKPPAGVRFAVQRGKADLLEPRSVSAEAIVFEFAIRVRDDRPDGRPNFLGPFSQGPPSARFVYVNSGMVGEPRSWTRRAKVPLAGITAAMIANATDGSVIEAKIAGTARDGGPACATVPLLEEGWKFSDH